MSVVPGVTESFTLLVAERCARATPMGVMTGIGVGDNGKSLALVLIFIIKVYLQANV